MESLVEVLVGSPDVAVGISGFGSARLGPGRWVDLGVLTGRTTYQLKYDAQVLPLALPLVVGAAEAYRRWKVARTGARVAADHLRPWLERWASSGRSVLVVGFSLGAYAAWEAIKGLAPPLLPKIQVVLVSGALADNPEQWEVAEDLDFLVNAYSSSDLVLNWLYPRGVGGDETPAAGLGPILCEGRRVVNVDLTSMIGGDHLWAGENLPRILRICLGAAWSLPPPRVLEGPSLGEVDLEEAGSPAREGLGAEAFSRLCSWTFCVPHAWDVLSRATRGDLDAISEALEMDRWSTSSSRLSALIEVGDTCRILSFSSVCREQSSASLSHMEGLVRHWLEGSWADSSSGGP